MRRGLVFSLLLGTAAFAQTSQAPPPLPAPAPLGTHLPDAPVSNAPATTPATGQPIDPQASAPQTNETTPAAQQPQPEQATPRAPQQFTRFAPPVAPVRNIGSLGSTYIPLDSWMYPEILRLYSLGYIDTVFLGMRPYTRLSVVTMLDQSADAIYNSGNDEAIDIYRALRYELAGDVESPIDRRAGRVNLDSVYTRVLGITGTPLRDSFHVGQTIINDYGRPYAAGFNNVTGASVRADAGRFSFYYRGEYQHAPQFDGYSLQTALFLTNVRDGIDIFTPNPTLPYGKYTDAQNNLRVLEGYAAVNIASHEVSFGKSDEWFGPGLGGGMGYSNNAENIYSFRINRVEPLYIPFVSRLLGPVRYDFMIGSLKGHTAPNGDYTHSEGFSFKPTSNVEIGFERTIVWGGKGHEPVTLHTFLKGFFDINDTTESEKLGRDDPGARFSAFNFTWRLPYLHHWLTLYTDSTVHDDVTPPSAPRRAGIRPGIYLAQFPGLHKLDLRVEGVSTDPPTGRSIGGSFLYWEAVQKQAYTNKGFIFGDWIGRESKGGQAWLTYNLSGNEYLQMNYRRAKAAKDFIDGGTTQDDYTFAAVKRLGKNVELNAWFQYEQWKAPLLTPNAQSDTSTAVAITWYPKNTSR